MGVNAVEEKKRRPINSDLIILACLAFVVLFFVIFSEIRSTYFDGGAGECLSISLFGKLELKSVDKAVLSENGKEFIITDAELIDQIVTETRVATHAGFCYDRYRRIDLYNGDKLIRSMEWAQCCDTVKVYEPDLTHWLIVPLGGTANEGYVELSDELVDQLGALIDAD